ncbi:MAG TPA: OmpA family protein [Polyangia bacterium]|nr:OmpA family protein [Polyangia bacterium]
MKIGFRIFAAALVCWPLALGCSHGQAAAPAAAAEAHLKAPDIYVRVPRSSDAGKLGGVVYFDFDQAELNLDGVLVLARVAERVKADPDARVRIEGNCDTRGTMLYNLNLGLRRAEAAKRFLVALGVSAERIDTVSFGFDRFSVRGNDEWAYRHNRRDEIRIVKR